MKKSLLTICIASAMMVTTFSASVGAEENDKFVNVVTSPDSGIEWIHLSYGVGEAGTDMPHIVFPDAQPFIDENDRVQIPVRALTETMGSDVGWDEASQTVTITNKDGMVISLTIGSDILTTDGEETKMDTAAVIKDDRTYVPLRFVAEAMGYYVSNYIIDGNAIINTDLIDQWFHHEQ